MTGAPLAAVVTPAGVAAVALIEVIGAGASAIVERLLGDTDLPEPGHTRHAWLFDAQGARLDDALVVAWGDERTPRYELGVHGGPAVVGAVLDALSAAGAAVVAPARLLDFGRDRGLVDPLTASAWRRVPRVRSTAALRVLADAFSGALQLAVVDAVEAGPVALEELLARSRAAAAWFRPLRVVLLGLPNAGKSSLFNALLGRERVTVSPEPGTTRDAVEEDTLWNGRFVRLIDTEGDAAPAALVRRADVLVEVVDATDPRETVRDPAASCDARWVRVWNKIDAVDDVGPAEVCPTSARTGEGVARLRERIAPGPAKPARPVVFSRADLRRLEAAVAGCSDAAAWLLRRAGRGASARGWRLFSGREND